VSDNTFSATLSALAAASFCFLVFNARSCQQSQDTEREKTNQEAIRAGLVEGEFGRWVKPGATP
jgi:predicted transcriptional regulator